MEIIKIPGFFFTHLAKNSDKFDLFHSGAMAPYYGVKSIEPFYVGFNYAQINKAKNIDVNIDFGNKILLKKIYFYSEFFSSKNVILLEFTGPLNEYVSQSHAFISKRSKQFY